MSQTAVSGDNRIDALLTTSQWGTSNGNSVSLTYSFPTSSSTWVSNYNLGEPFSPNTLTYLNSTQQENVEEALELWSNVANITFTEVTEPGTQGQIRVTYSSIISGNTAGWAYEPPSSSTVFAESGDVWLNPDKLTELSSGTQGFATLIHELGHALGFKHPFTGQSNNSATLSSAEDSTQYTAMSYTDYDGVGSVYTRIGNTNTFSVVAVQPTTPMLYDILAMQFLYGANTSYNTGDDTYTFSNSAAELKTIWDAGGTDTFDLSNQTYNMSINLNAGEFSSLGIRQTDVNGTIESALENVAIAFDVEIENAIGGSGNDTITGNSLANQMTGGEGNDTLTGGSGSDTAIYTGNIADYTIQTVSSNLQISSLSSNEGTDTLSGIEMLQFADVLVDASTLETISTSSIIPSTPTEVDTMPTEGDSNHTNYFLLQITSALSVDASVSYTTQDGTATAGLDYISTSGTATISAGETSTVIGVEIIGDNTSEGNETFLLAISNPQGGIFPTGVTEITATRTIVDDDSSTDILSEIQIIGVDDGMPV